MNGQAWQDFTNPSYKSFNVNKYVGVPCNQTCHNGGTCLPYLNSFTCKCSPGFSGDLCDLRKLKQWLYNDKRNPKFN